MKNLVRGVVVLSLISLFVVFIYAQTKTETALSIANDSPIQLNTTELNSNKVPVKVKKEEVKQETPTAEVSTEGTTKANTKLVKSTALVTRAAAGVNKGSFFATAYCLKGRTAMGHGVRRGIIAADPRVLRLGTRVNLGAGSYSGQYLVSDTGGAVKGREIDIWVPNCAEARRFGRRKVNVSVLE